MQSDTIISLEAFVKNSNKYIADLKVTHHPILLTQDDKKIAVLQDAEQYEKWLKAVALLKRIVKSENEILEGKLRNQTDVLADIQKRLDLIHES